MRKIIKFTAAWCSSCKQMDKVLEQVALEFPQYEIIKVDIDNSSDLAIKYGVRGIPTLIRVEPANGEDEVEVGRLVGFKTFQQVQEWMYG